MIDVYQATNLDLRSLQVLFDQYREFYGVKPAPELSLAFIKQRLKKNDSVIFMATLNQQPAGFTQIYPSFSSVAMQPLWILNDLFVTQKCRSKGVAKMLITKVHTEARLNKIFSIKLATGNKNITAQKLYLSMGYKLIDQFEHYSKKID